MVEVISELFLLLRLYSSFVLVLNIQIHIRWLRIPRSIATQPKQRHFLYVIQLFHHVFRFLELNQAEF